MSQHGWSVSAGFAMGLFSSNASYSGAVQETSSETWSEEKEESYTISVTRSKSVFVWQYTFTISQFGEEVKFMSSIIGNTNDVNIKPDIKAAAKKSPNTIVIASAKTVLNGTFIITRKTDLKYSSCCGSVVLDFSHARFTV